MAAPSALQYEKEITVEHYQCDLRDQLPMGGLLRQIQQISTDHCDALGITAQRYQDTNTAFLLAKISVECLRPIVAGERLRVVTRPSAPVRAIYYRFTSILDEQGREICSADARWTLIDTQKRRILRNPPPALGLPFTAPAERTLELSMPRPAELERLGEFTASYSRTDRNGHLNNTFYADLTCDALPLEQISQRSLRCMTLYYHKELRLGQSMELFRAPEGPDGWYVCGTLPQGKCFEAHAVFADSEERS